MRIDLEKVEKMKLRHMPRLEKVHPMLLHTSGGEREVTTCFSCGGKYPCDIRELIEAFEWLHEAYWNPSSDGV